MAQIEARLRRLISSRYRLAGVIILSFVIGLSVVLPLVDEYQDSRRQRAEAEMALGDARLAAANLQQFERRVRQQMVEFEKLERRTLSEKRARAFRSQVVDLARQAGCQIRRIREEKPQSRDWLKNDDPLATVAGRKRKKDETGYLLKSRVFTLSVTGSLTNIKQLLADLHARRHLAHTRSLSLRPDRSNRKQAVLEIELWLFDLARKKAMAT